MTQFAANSWLQQLSSFWAWWTHELKAVVPDSLRLGATQRAQSFILPERQSVTVERLVAGVGERHVDARGLDALDDEAWVELADLTAATRTSIRLSPPDCHVARLTLPLAARGHLRAAIALRLDDITPLDPALIVWAPQIVGQQDNSLSVVVAIARASLIADMRARFGAHDIAMPPVVVRIDDRDIVVDSGDGQQVSAEVRTKRRIWTLVAALLVSVPFSTILFARLTTSTLDAKIAAAEIRVKPKLAAERHWKRDEALRIALLPVVSRPSASAIIEKLANTLPKTATAQSVDVALSQNLTFSADTSDAQALADALAATPHLRDVTLVNETPGTNDMMRLTYRAMPR